MFTFSVEQTDFDIRIARILCDGSSILSCHSMNQVRAQKMCQRLPRALYSFSLRLAAVIIVTDRWNGILYLYFPARIACECVRSEIRTNMCQFSVSMRECTAGWMVVNAQAHLANSPIFFQRRKWSLVILKHFVVIFHFRCLCNCRGCLLWRCPVFVSDHFLFSVFFIAV